MWLLAKLQFTQKLLTLWKGLFWPPITVTSAMRSCSGGGAAILCTQLQPKLSAAPASQDTSPPLDVKNMTPLPRFAEILQVHFAKSGADTLQYTMVLPSSWVCFGIKLMDRRVLFTPRITFHQLFLGRYNHTRQKLNKYTIIPSFSSSSHHRVTMGIITIHHSRLRPKDSSSSGERY